MKSPKKHNKVEKIEKEGAEPAEIVPVVIEGEFVSATIEWQAPEFDYAPKDVSWFWISFLAAMGLVAFALWERNFLFAVFVTIAWFTFVALANRFPPLWEFSLHDKGLTIRRPGSNLAEKMYSWEMMEGFDIHEAAEEYKELLIKVHSRFSPYLKINIHADHEGKIQDFLVRYIPREEYEKSMADALQNLIGF